MAVMAKRHALASVVKTEGLENKIFIVRGCRVMLDADLAAVYRVSTKRLNEQVKRNRSRFPKDFMFQLAQEEMVFLMRSQIATASKRNIRHLPYVFTEHGAVMLASVLNSRVAIEASILVVRAFVRLRSLLAAHKELAKKIEAMERKYDARFRVVFAAIKQLMRPAPEPPEDDHGPIGFRVGGA